MRAEPLVLASRRGLNRGFHGPARAKRGLLLRGRSDEMILAFQGPESGECRLR